MSEKRHYTPERMREEANFHAFRNGDGYIVVEMLRQAADTEEQLKLALTTAGNQSDEIARLKAQLDAVKCKVMDLRRELYKVGSPDLYKTLTDAILVAARGEGGAG